MSSLNIPFSMAKYYDVNPEGQTYFSGQERMECLMTYLPFIISHFKKASIGKKGQSFQDFFSCFMVKAFLVSCLRHKLKITTISVLIFVVILDVSDIHEKRDKTVKVGKETSPKEKNYQTNVAKYKIQLRKNIQSWKILFA
ncbi:CLUMA_CG018528, isoform A [Clunio marinus]|uniref:CLUMA_CG018528, isoform A n=1 Tax=Clunio marinus TaxID=568069 RepID=A0A1J1IZQ2_9DIPT|nr:CLUMA_CG018528, isoform A [Clunio marinus]